MTTTHTTEEAREAVDATSPVTDAPVGAPPAPAMPSVVATPASRRRLTLVFLWLLGGDFAFTFFEQIFGRFIPLFAVDLHGSNTLVGLMTGSFAGAMNLLFLPSIAMRSDRHRGRLGRRVPLLLWATPCTVASLLLVCFAPEIGHGLAGWLGPASPVSAVSLTLGLLCLFVVSYHFWNMVLVNGYNWLIRDVVPPAVIGRFLSWFRLVSTISSFLFLWYVFPVVLSHRKVVFCTIGLTYLLIFLGMCWQVREPAYPPPEPKRDGVLRSYLNYFRECLAVPMFRSYFLVYVLMVASTSTVNPFLTLLARERLGLDMTDMGRIFAWGTLAAAIAYLPMGWVCDRFRPIRVTIVAVATYSITLGAAYCFVDDRSSWLAFTLASAVPLAAWMLGCTALTIELFPAAKFGQFSAGLNVFGYGGVIAANFLLGRLIDLTHGNYALAFAWGAVLSAAAFALMWHVYGGWKRHGGPNAYVPPEPASRAVA